jgi:uncharacterized protein
MPSSSVKISSLHVYPVKSCRGIDLPQSEVGGDGLKHDRRYLITDQKGKFLTQRELPKMATLRPELQGSDLFLAHGAERMNLSSIVTSTKTTVEVWKDGVSASDLGPQAAEFVTDVLGSYEGGALKVFRIDPSYNRATSAEKYGVAAKYAFSDSFPYLILSQASLDDLNDKLKDSGSPKVPMNRFRPSIVLDGIGPYGEDTAKELQIEGTGIRFAVVTPCTRCRITTVDQESGEMHKEPLITLRKHRFVRPYGICFGSYAVLSSGQGSTLKVGAKVSVT